MSMGDRPPASGRKRCVTMERSRAKVGKPGDGSSPPRGGVSWGLSSRGCFLVNLHIGMRQCLGQPRPVGVTSEGGPISRIACPSGSSLFHRNSGRLPFLSDRPHRGSRHKGSLSILRDKMKASEKPPRRGSNASEKLRPEGSLLFRHLGIRPRADPGGGRSRLTRRMTSSSLGAGPAALSGGSRHHD